MTSEAFASAIIGMTQTLYRVCYAQLSQACDRQDAVQEALRKAWEKRDSLRNEEYLKTWLIRILLNECRTIQRKSKRVLPYDEPPMPKEGKTEHSDIKLALLSLPDAQRMPVVLHYMEGYSLEDTAKALRLPVTTVKSRLQRAKQALRAVLSEEAFS